MTVGALAPMQVFDKPSHARALKRLRYEDIVGITLKPDADRNGNVYCELTIQSTGSPHISFQLAESKCYDDFMHHAATALKLPTDLPLFAVDIEKNTL
jgi:hypothetical protein